MGFEKYQDVSKDDDNRELIIKSIKAELRQKMPKDERLLLQLKLRELEHDGIVVDSDTVPLVQRYFTIRRALGLGAKGEERKRMMKEYYELRDKLRI